MSKQDVRPADRLTAIKLDLDASYAHDTVAEWYQSIDWLIAEVERWQRGAEGLYRMWAPDCPRCRLDHPPNRLCPKCRANMEEGLAREEILC